ncbi:hypothetical protein [Escherichia coli]|uniref:hypothetical protein n=1 Tax=Escherichia coli TaxID=562 RepID=UPI000BE62719|nr:hypothetical protein [Escherichia coli]PJI56130.1 hypothetical protein CTU84_25820 [Escherichia coli]PJI60947.1 hypothetical protein CTY41_25490 [Escherichia coli]
MRHKYKIMEKGLSLIESAMVLTLAAAVTAGVLYFYNSTKENNALLETTKGLQSIISATQSLYGSRGQTAGATLSAQAVSAVSGIEIGTPKIAKGEKTVFYMPGGIAEATFFLNSTNNNKTVFTVHTASKDACMGLAVLNLGTMATGKPRVKILPASQQAAYSQVYNTAKEISTPADAASECNNINASNIARIMYELKVQ